MLPSCLRRKTLGIDVKLFTRQERTEESRPLKAAWFSCADHGARWGNEIEILFAPEVQLQIKERVPQAGCRRRLEAVSGLRDYNVLPRKELQYIGGSGYIQRLRI